MSHNPKNVHQEQVDATHRLLSFELVRLAQQLAAQSGAECPRPVPAEWIEKAFEVHQAEFDLTLQTMWSYWDSIAPDTSEADQN